MGINKTERLFKIFVARNIGISDYRFGYWPWNITNSLDIQQKQCNLLSYVNWWGISGNAWFLVFLMTYFILFGIQCHQRFSTFFVFLLCQFCTLCPSAFWHTPRVTRIPEWVTGENLFILMRVGILWISGLWSNLWLVLQ